MRENKFAIVLRVQQFPWKVWHAAGQRIHRQRFSLSPKIFLVHENGCRVPCCCLLLRCIVATKPSCCTPIYWSRLQQSPSPYNTKHRVLPQFTRSSVHSRLDCAQLAIWQLDYSIRLYHPQQPVHNKQYTLILWCSYLKLKCCEILSILKYTYLLCRQLLSLYNMVAPICHPYMFYIDVSCHYYITADNRALLWYRAFFM